MLKLFTIIIGFCAIYGNFFAQIHIFTISGKLVRTIIEYMHTEGFRSEGIAWNGRDDFGNQLAKGVYVYRFKIKTPDGGTAEKTEKLVLLR